jgi:hypothetical protein
MDLTQDFIEANGLEANQVEAITKYIDSEVKPFASIKSCVKSITPSRL